MVADGAVGYGVGKAIEAHDEASKRLEYPAALPPPPFGPTSDWHRQQIREIERQRQERELQRMERMELLGRTG